MYSVSVGLSFVHYKHGSVKFSQVTRLEFTVVVTVFVVVAM